MGEYYPYLQKDMSEVMEYIPLGIVMGAIASFLIVIGYYLMTQRWQWEKLFIFFLFITYVAVVIQIAYLSRPPGSRTDVAWGLGDTWGTTIQAHAYVIENVMMFIPFGILFPMLGRIARTYCIPAAICSSMVLEGMQYITQRGYCQLDDIVTNVIGACIGYIFFYLVHNLAKCNVP